LEQFTCRSLLTKCLETENLLTYRWILFDIKMCLFLCFIVSFLYLFFSSSHMKKQTFCYILCIYFLSLLFHFISFILAFLWCLLWCWLWFIQGLFCTFLPKL
jgi:hypothetical protein